MSSEKPFNSNKRTIKEIIIDKIGKWEDINNETNLISSEDLRECLKISLKKIIERKEYHTDLYKTSFNKYLRYLNLVEEEIQQEILLLFLTKTIIKQIDIEEYLNLATPETLQQSLVDGTKYLIDLFASHVSLEKIYGYLTLMTGEHLEKTLKSFLPTIIINGFEIDTIINLANTKKLETEKILQYALETGLGIRIRRLQPIEMYLTYATNETMEKIKLIIKTNLIHFIQHDNNIPEKYIDLVAEEVLENKVLQRYLAPIAARPSFFTRKKIDKLLKLITSETMEKILNLGMLNIIFFELKIEDFTKEFLKLGKIYNLNTNEILQEALCVGLQRLVTDGKEIGKYIPFADEDTKNKIKIHIKIGLIKLIKEDKSIPREYFDFITEETLHDHTLQEMLFAILRNKIKESGLKKNNLDNLQQYLKLITKTTAEKLFNIEILKHDLWQLTMQFFKNKSSYILKKHVWDTIQLLTKEQIWNALFDRTTLPIGIKFHVSNKTPLYEILNKTGGFVAHGEEQCFVANPVTSQTILKIIFDAMEKYLQEQNCTFKNITYIQTCCLGRLPNKHAGIATFAFLMNKGMRENIDTKTIIHEQDTFGITIPDGGRVEIGFLIPNEKGFFHQSTISERTDLLFCRDIDEVFLANDLLTLLNHTSLQINIPLFFKKLGKEFIKDVTLLLEEYGLKESFERTKFINVRETDIPKLLEFIEIIKNLRIESEKILKKIDQANDLAKTSIDEQEIEMIRFSYDKLTKQYKNTLPYKLAILVKKYRHSLKPDGLTKCVIENPFSEEGF